MLRCDPHPAVHVTVTRGPRCCCRRRASPAAGPDSWSSESGGRSPHRGTRRDDPGCTRRRSGRECTGAGAGGTRAGSPGWGQVCGGPTWRGRVACPHRCSSWSWSVPSMASRRWQAGHRIHRGNVVTGNPDGGEGVVGRVRIIRRGSQFGDSQRGQSPAGPGSGVGGSEIGRPRFPQASRPRTTTLIPGRSTTAPTPAANISWLGRALPIRVAWRAARAHRVSARWSAGGRGCEIPGGRGSRHWRRRTAAATGSPVRRLEG